MEEQDIFPDTIPEIGKEISVILKEGVIFTTLTDGVSTLACIQESLLWNHENIVYEVTKTDPPGIMDFLVPTEENPLVWKVDFSSHP